MESMIYKNHEVRHDAFNLKEKNLSKKQLETIAEYQAIENKISNYLDSIGLLSKVNDLILKQCVVGKCKEVKVPCPFCSGIVSVCVGASGYIQYACCSNSYGENKKNLCKVWIM